jgi:hypothetical protein
VTTFGYRRDALDAWAAVDADASATDGAVVPKMNVMLLLSRLQLTHRDAAAEVSRFRATGLMLRNATVPTACALLIALTEIVTGPRPAVAAAFAVLFALMTVGFARFGAQMRYWANTKTYQFALWTGATAPLPASDQPAQPTDRHGAGPAS